MNVILKRERAWVRRERRESRSDGKGGEREAKGKSDEYKTRDKERKAKHAKGSEYVLNQLNAQRIHMFERGTMDEVHDTRLTGAMMARACGAHQGTG